MKAKLINRAVLAVAISVAAISCEQDHVQFNTYDSPDWKVDMEGHVDAPSWSVDSRNPENVPDWKLDVKGTDGNPGWKAVANDDFQFSMTMALQLSDYLSQWESDGDAMAAFVGKECRGVATKEKVGGKTVYMIYMKGDNTTADKVSLKYYSATSGRIYSCDEITEFEQNAVFGTASEPEIPQFEKSGKYPYSMQAVVALSAPVAEQSTGDVMAAFVGTECRGIGEPVTLADGTAAYSFDIRGAKANEADLWFKYYNAKESAVYNSRERLAFADGTDCGTAANPKALEFLPENSMTAVVAIPSSMQATADEADQVAAFVGDKCCGVGEAIDANGVKCYAVTIRSSEAGKVSFRYYSAHNSYLYETGELTDFADGGAYGTADAPKVLPISYDGKYPYMMKAVIELPGSLAEYDTAADKFAAFVGNECRSVGERNVTNDGRIVYTFKIVGNEAADQTVKFRYYSAKFGYIYESLETVNFENGSDYGTELNPTIPGFKGI